MWLRNLKEPEGQLARWLEKLEEFQFEVVHRKGKAHCNADALSRMFSQQTSNVDVVCPATIAPVVLATALGGKSHQDIRKCQMEDDLIGPIFQVKVDGIKPSADTVKGCDPKYRKLVQIWDQLIIKDDLLWRLFENNDGTGCTFQLVIPNSMKTAVLHDVHDGVLGGHLAS